MCIFAPKYGVQSNTTIIYATKFAMSSLHTNMSKWATTVLFFCLTVLFSHAQCLQRVLVVEYNGENTKTPLSNVEIVVGNAGSSVTDNEGRCTLNFRTLKPGDKVSVRRIEKPGYEVFNNDVVSNWFLPTQDIEFVIVMCKEELLISLRSKYRKSATESFTQEYENQEKIINQNYKSGKYTDKNYAIELEKIKAEYEKKLDNIENYIDRFIYVDLTNLNEEEKKIHELVEQGNYSAAIKAYEELDAIGLYKKELESSKALEWSKMAIDKRQAELNAQRAHIYHSHLKQIDLLWIKGGEESVEKAWEIQREFAYVDTTYATPMIDYANACIAANRLEEAENAVRICINNPNPEVNLQGEILKCQIFAKKHQYLKMKDKLQQLCTYLREQSKEKMYDEFYLTERSKVLGMLVSACNSTLDTELSRQYLEEMFEVSKLNFELNKTYDTKQQLAEAYHNAFVLYHNISQYDKALNMIDSALIYANELYEEGGKTQPVLLAFFTSHKATLLSSMRRYKEALKEFWNADKLYEQSRKNNPKAYVNYIAENYLNCTELHITSKIYPLEGDEDPNFDLSISIPFFISAEKYIDEEMEMNPESATNKRAWLYAQLCLYNFLQGDYNKGTEYFYKATEIKATSMDNNPLKSQKYIKDLHDEVLKVLKRNPEANADRIKHFESAKSNLNF